MAYVRRRGNQLAIVHGEREPNTGTVGQRILFALYSRAEALEVLGRGSKGGVDRFRRLLEEQYPGLRFNWKRIRRSIEEHLAALPDHYSTARSGCALVSATTCVRSRVSSFSRIRRISNRPRMSSRSTAASSSTWRT